MMSAQAAEFGDKRLSHWFWDKCIPEPNSGCWLWLGRLRRGYGRFARTGCHRYAYRKLVGAIPDGLQIDHLCRTTCCVNPAHLEAVTQRENTLRGEGVSARNARKAHCPSCGGPYVVVFGDRRCAPCDNATVRRYRMMLSQNALCESGPSHGPAVDGTTRCMSCLERHRVASKRSKDIQRAARRAAGLCVECGAPSNGKYLCPPHANRNSVRKKAQRLLRSGSAEIAAAPSPRAASLDSPPVAPPAASRQTTTAARATAPRVAPRATSGDATPRAAVPATLTLAAQERGR